MPISKLQIQAFDSPGDFSDEFRRVTKSSSQRPFVPRNRVSELELCAGGTGVRLPHPELSASRERVWIRLFEGVYFTCLRGDGSGAPLSYRGSHVQEEMLHIIHLFEGQYSLQMDRDLHPINAGDWLVYSRHVGTDITGWTAKGRPYEIFGFLFFGNGLANALEYFGLNSPALIERCLRTPESCALQIARSFSNLRTDLHDLASVDPTEDGLSRAELLRHKVGEMLILLGQANIKHVENLAGPLTMQELRAIEHARELIDTNLRTPPSLSQLSAITGLNRNKLAIGFRTICKQSMKKYRSVKRLELTQELLFHSDLPLTDIADQAGFSTQANFTRAFTKHYGVSPLRARKKHLLRKSIRSATMKSGCDSISG